MDQTEFVKQQMRNALQQHIDRHAASLRQYEEQFGRVDDIFAEAPRICQKAQLTMDGVACQRYPSFVRLSVGATTATVRWINFIVDFDEKGFTYEFDDKRYSSEESLIAAMMKHKT
jgi:hypothetical protein